MNAVFVILKDLSDFQMVIVVLFTILLIFGLSAFAKLIRRLVSGKAKPKGVKNLNHTESESLSKNKTLEHIIDNQELINGK
jgi:flagellar biogenesis protein FliO